MSVRPSSLVLGLVLVAAAAAAAVSLNLLLLGRATRTSDPVGHLQLHVHLPAAPQWTVRPTEGRIDDRGADD